MAKSSRPRKAIITRKELLILIACIVLYLIADAFELIKIDEPVEQTAIETVQESQDVQTEQIDLESNLTFVEEPFDIDGTLKESVRYMTGEYEYYYETDEEGRIVLFETDDLQLTTREERLPHDGNTPGKIKGDHAGHLAGDRFGGSPHIDNLVSQSAKVNLSTYKKMENAWAQALEDGKKVTVEVEVIYTDEDMRPDEFDVEYTIDGEYFTQHLMNWWEIIVMDNEKIILECSKKIASAMDDYWPACDKAYFHGINAENGDLLSVDVFFEKDGMLMRKNLVTYFDLIDCHQPRNISDQRDLMKELMSEFKEFSAAFRREFNPCFTVCEITLFNENVRHTRVRFEYDEHVLDDLEGGAHELHQKYFEQIKTKLEEKR